MLHPIHDLVRSALHAGCVIAVTAILATSARGCVQEAIYLDVERAKANNVALMRMADSGADPIAARCAIENDASSPQCLLAIARSSSK